MHSLTKKAQTKLKGGLVMMDDKFFMGVVLGMLGGAVLVTNSVKARQMVKDGQNQVKQKVAELGEKSKSNKNS
jgi:hypothetical protein